MHQLKELGKGDTFIFNKTKWKHMGHIRGHTHTVDCMDGEGRHRPFKDTVEVEPDQIRIAISI